MLHGCIQNGIQTLTVPQHYETDIVAHHCLVFSGHSLEHEFHKSIHLFLGAAPVFFGECEEGEIRDAPFGTCFCNRADALNAFCMSESAFLAAFLGPAAVSIHNDGYVSG